MTEPKDLLLVNEQLRRSNRLLRWLNFAVADAALVSVGPGQAMLVVGGVIWGIVQYITWVIQRVLSTPVGF